VYLKLKHDEIRRVSKVGDGQGIFGGGLLLSDVAASKLHAAFCEADRIVRVRNTAWCNCLKPMKKSLRN
jgi:hypothetical protein